MITGIVLAAGTASRYGATKQLAVLDGRPLVQHAIDALAAASVDEIVVVLGHDAARVHDALALPAGARTVVAERYASGQAASLAAGLGACDAASEAAVVLLADQPDITAEHVRRLVAAFRDEPAPILRLRFDDGPGPALLARSVWDEAMALEGDTGARALMTPDRVREVRVDGPAPRDVDLPGDLADA